MSQDSSNGNNVDVETTEETEKENLVQISSVEPYADQKM